MALFFHFLCHIPGTVSVCETFVGFYEKMNGRACFLLIVRLRKCIQCRPSSWIFQRIFQRGFTRFATRVLQRRGSVTVEVIGNYAKICHLPISRMFEIKQIFNLYNSHGWSKIIGLVPSLETPSPPRSLFCMVWSTKEKRACILKMMSQTRRILYLLCIHRNILDHVIVLVIYSQIKLKCICLCNIAVASETQVHNVENTLLSYWMNIHKWINKWINGYTSVVYSIYRVITP